MNPQRRTASLAEILAAGEVARANRLLKTALAIPAKKSTAARGPATPDRTTFGETLDAELRHARRRPPGA